MRGILRSSGHQYKLDADIVSIGRGANKDILPPIQARNIQNHIQLDSDKTDPYHAILERNPSANCYVLTDLNSAYGTYVNEHRVQNATVKLTSGDTVRFGHGGIPHEFRTTSADLPDVKPNTQRQQHNSGYGSSSLSKKYRVETGYLDNRNKRKPIPNAREDRSHSVPINILMINHGEQEEESNQGNNNLPDVEQQKNVHTPEGWSQDGQQMIDSWEKETSCSKSMSKEASTPVQTPNEPWYVAMLREKEQRLLRMGDEVCRLGIAEAESKRKDNVISELRHKVTEMEQAVLDLKNNTNAAEKDRKLLQMGDEINRLSVFERECERKDYLVASLRDQIAKLEIDQQALIMETHVIEAPEEEQDNRNVADEIKNGVMDGKLIDIDDTLLEARDSLDELRRQLDLPLLDRRESEDVMMQLRESLEEKDETISKLQEELKYTTREKNLSDGLVQSLQRDASYHEHRAKKLTIALEKEKRQSQDYEIQVQTMSNKFANLKDEKKHEEMIGTMEKEIRQLKEQLSEKLQHNVEQEERLEKQDKELRRTSKQSKQFMDSGKITQVHADELNTELVELRQKELSMRVAHEHTQARLERLRSRIVQAVYSAPGAVKPENQLGDGEIIGSLQKIIDDRSEFHQQLIELGQSMPPLVGVLDLGAEETPSDTESHSHAPERKSAKSGRRSAKRS